MEGLESLAAAAEALRSPRKSHRGPASFDEDGEREDEQPQLEQADALNKRPTARKNITFSSYAKDLPPRGTFTSAIAADRQQTPRPEQQQQQTLRPQAGPPAFSEIPAGLTPSGDRGLPRASSGPALQGLAWAAPNGVTKKAAAQPTHAPMGPNGPASYSGADRRRQARLNTWIKVHAPEGLLSPLERSRAGLLCHIAAHPDCPEPFLRSSNLGPASYLSQALKSLLDGAFVGRSGGGGHADPFLYSLTPKWLPHLAQAAGDLLRDAAARKEVDRTLPEDLRQDYEEAVMGAKGQAEELLEENSNEGEDAERGGVGAVEAMEVDLFGKAGGSQKRPRKKRGGGVVAATAAAPAPPRKRPRVQPPRVAPAPPAPKPAPPPPPPQTIAIGADGDPIPVPVKRGPGRPRKNALPVVPPPAGAAAEGGAAVAAVSAVEAHRPIENPKVAVVRPELTLLVKPAYKPRTTQRSRQAAAAAAAAVAAAAAAAAPVDGGEPPADAEPGDEEAATAVGGPAEKEAAKSIQIETTAVAGASAEPEKVVAASPAAEAGEALAAGRVVSPLPAPSLAAAEAPAAATAAASPAEAADLPAPAAAAEMVEVSAPPSAAPPPEVADPLAASKPPQPAPAGIGALSIPSPAAAAAAAAAEAEAADLPSGSAPSQRTSTRMRISPPQKVLDDSGPGTGRPGSGRPAGGAKHRAPTDEAKRRAGRMKAWIASVRTPDLMKRTDRARAQVIVHLADSQRCSEVELRRAYGNNPDVSKALRGMYEEGLLARGGEGNKVSPFVYSLMPEAQPRVEDLRRGLEADAAAQEELDRIMPEDLKAVSPDLAAAAYADEDEEEEVEEEEEIDEPPSPSVPVSGPKVRKRAPTGAAMKKEKKKRGRPGRPAAGTDGGEGGGKKGKRAPGSGEGKASSEAKRRAGRIKAWMAANRPAALMTRVDRAKAQVLVLMGDKPETQESEMRINFGNNPDVSKALRHIVEEGLASRTGAGTKPSPFVYRLLPKGRAQVELQRGKLAQDTTAQTELDLIMPEDLKGKLSTPEELVAAAEAVAAAADRSSAGMTPGDAAGPSQQLLQAAETAAQGTHQQEQQPQASEAAPTGMQVDA